MQVVNRRFYCKPLDCNVYTMIRLTPYVDMVETTGFTCDSWEDAIIYCELLNKCIRQRGINCS